MIGYKTIVSLSGHHLENPEDGQPELNLIPNVFFFQEHMCIYLTN